MDKDINWDELAKSVLQAEAKSIRKIKELSNNDIIKGFITWRGKNYTCNFQEVAPYFSKEIILLAKPSYPLKIELIDAIKKLDKERIELYADDDIDLEGRQHILRRVGNKITYLTTSQTAFMVDNPINITEIGYL